MKRKALGRGLSALIPEEQAPGKGKGGDYFVCPIDKIKPAPGQPRKNFDAERLAELAASLQEQGLIQPLVVRPKGRGTYELVAGERRWRAAQKAGLHQVPVVIRKVDDRQAIEMALVENLQREDLNPLEEADALQALVEEHGYTQEKLAARLGRDRSTVANSLRLLKLPRAARQALVAGTISAGHARALLGLDDEAAMLRLLQQIVALKLSVRQTEAAVKRQKQQGEAPPAKKPTLSANERDLQERLARSLKTRVRLRPRDKGKGKIEISYDSLDELDRLLEQLL